MFFVFELRAKSWTYSAGHANEAHGGCAASRVPGQLEMVVVATPGVVAWRAGVSGLVGALQV